MTITHTLSRIVATDTEVLRFIWSDGYEITQAPGWQGWFRGVTAGWFEGEEYERYDGKSPFDNEGTVLQAFLDNGGVVEPYVPPPAPEEEPVP